MAATDDVTRVIPRMLAPATTRRPLSDATETLRTA